MSIHSYLEPGRHENCDPLLMFIFVEKAMYQIVDFGEVIVV